MTLPGWGRKVLLLAIIPVPQYPVIITVFNNLQASLIVFSFNTKNTFVKNLPYSDFEETIWPIIKVLVSI